MPPRLFSPVQEADIARRYLAGESLRAIASTLGTTHHVLSGSLLRQNVTQRDAPERNRLYALNANTFDVIDTEAKAYWLGFLFADGTVFHRTVILMLAEKDASHVFDFGTFLESEAVVKQQLVFRGFLQRRIEITDRHLADRLRELGIETGRPRPLASFSATPDTLKQHWIRGFFDGDGSVKLKAQAMFCGHHELLAHLQDVLAPEVGWRGSLYPHNKGTIWYLCYAGRNSCMALAAYLYRDATVFLQRKFDRFQAWPAPPPDFRERPRKNGRWIKAED